MLPGALRAAVSGLLLVVLLCAGSSLGAFAAASCSPPATTVFFVNGINNTLEAAAASRDALALRVGSPVGGECVGYALAHNLTFAPLVFDPAVVEAHVRLYRTELALGNRVLLVAHSNGNVYADEAYKRLGVDERPSVGVVAVATLLGSVPGNGPYVTLLEDALVAVVPGHLPANTTNTGGVCPEGFGCHDFVRFYLDGVESGPKIVQAVSATIPGLVRPPPGASLALSLNQTSFRPGDTLRVTLRVTNPGPARSVDFYLGRLSPDGATVSFITSLAPLASVTVKTSEPDTFVPIAGNVQVPHGVDVTIPDVLVTTLPPDFPPGTSVFFAAMTAPGTLDLAAPVAATELPFAD